MSAIAEHPDEPVEVIQVLFALHPNFGAQELCGPLEVLSNALQKMGVPGKSRTSTFVFNLDHVANPSSPLSQLTNQREPQTPKPSNAPSPPPPLP
jgi:hypothetical protein